MKCWSLKTSQTEGFAVAPVNVTNNSIISNTARKQQQKRHEYINVWLYYKMEKDLGSTTLLGV